MISNIEIWWEYSFKLGELVQQIENSSTDNKIDGKSIWNGIECQVIDVNIIGLKYNNLKNIYEKMLFLINKYEMTNNEYPKYNHFFMQLMNIVDKKSNFEIKLNRVLQLAYNAGQLSMLIKLKKIPEDIKNCLLENNLLLLDTYVSKENQDIINKNYLNGTHLDKLRENIHNLGGGSIYYYKYLKYKQKYLKIKNM